MLFGTVSYSIQNAKLHPITSFAQFLLLYMIIANTMLELASFQAFPPSSFPFLHTARDKKLGGRKAWEWGSHWIFSDCFSEKFVLESCCCVVHGDDFFFCFCCRCVVVIVAVVVVLLLFLLLLLLLSLLLLLCCCCCSCCCCCYCHCCCCCVVVAVVVVIV